MDWKAVFIGVIAILWLIGTVVRGDDIIDYKQVWDFDDNKWVTLTFFLDEKGEIVVKNKNDDVTDRFRVEIVDGRMIYYLKEDKYNER